MPNFLVSREDRQLTLADFLRRKLSLSWSRAKGLIDGDKVYLNGARCRQIDRRLQPGDSVEVREAASAPKSKSPKPSVRPVAQEKPKYTGTPPRIVYLDDDIVVVDKPAGLTAMRHREEALEFGPGKQRFLPVTLEEILPGLLGQPNRKPIAVHRIDKDTSGLIVFARTRGAAEKLEADFREHKLERRYLALTRGIPSSGIASDEFRIETHFVSDRGDGRRGSAQNPTPESKQAISHFRILRKFNKFALVECRLETGRTHQVRIHLGELGAPLCGERVYDRPLHGNPVPDTSGAKRQMLHAAVLGLSHPRTGEKWRWECDLPEDMQRLLVVLGERGA